MVMVTVEKYFLLERKSKKPLKQSMINIMLKYVECICDINRERQYLLNKWFKASRLYVSIL